MTSGFVVAFLAALLGGALNAVAGGGSFLTFPALVFIGLPPVVANVTSTVGLWPGAVASAFAYRRELRQSTGALPWLAAASVVGGVLGAVLLLRTPERWFVRLLPFLLLVASLVFTAGPAVLRRKTARAARPGRPSELLPHPVAAVPRSGGQRVSLVLRFLIQVLIATYGGYFGGGLGILMLASFTFWGQESIHEQNALKTVLAALINGVSIVTFVLDGRVAWPLAVLMMTGGMLGGYLGADVARRLPAQRVRGFVLAVAWSMTVLFFVRGYA